MSKYVVETKMFDKYRTWKENRKKESELNKPMDKEYATLFKSFKTELEDHINTLNKKFKSEMQRDLNEPCSTQTPTQGGKFQQFSRVQ